MSAKRGLVLDANILVRAVFGKKVRRILESSNEDILFCSPDHCFREAHRNIPAISKRRGLDSDTAFTNLDEVAQSIESVDASAYSAFREPARQRIAP